MPKRAIRQKSLSTHEKAEVALKEAVRKLVLERKHTGEPLVVWKNGKVAKISAAEASAQALMAVDTKARAVYLKFNQHDVDRTERIHPVVSLDYDKNNALVGVEVIRVKKGVLAHG